MSQSKPKKSVQILEQPSIYLLSKFPRKIIMYAPCYFDNNTKLIRNTKRSNNAVTIEPAQMFNKPYKNCILNLYGIGEIFQVLDQFQSLNSVITGKNLKIFCDQLALQFPVTLQCTTYENASQYLNECKKTVNLTKNTIKKCVNNGEIDELIETAISNAKDLGVNDYASVAQRIPTHYREQIEKSENETVKGLKELLKNIQQDNEINDKSNQEISEFISSLKSDSTNVNSKHKKKSAKRKTEKIQNKLPLKRIRRTRVSSPINNNNVILMNNVPINTCTICDRVSIDFDLIGYGFESREILTLNNTLNEPLQFTATIPLDMEHNEFQIAKYNSFSLCPSQNNNTNAKNWSFNGQLYNGIIDPNSFCIIEICIKSIRVHKYKNYTMKIEFEHEDIMDVSLPIVANCITPTINVSANKINLGNCFIEQTYCKSFTIENRNEVAGVFLIEIESSNRSKAQIMLQETAGIIYGNKQKNLKYRIQPVGLGLFSIMLKISIVGSCDYSIIELGGICVSGTSTNNNQSNTTSIESPPSNTTIVNCNTHSLSLNDTATRILINILNENNNELNRDALVSLLNKQINNNNGINWRKSYQLMLGDIDEFIKDNDKLAIENESKRNYLVKLIQKNENDNENENDDGLVDKINQNQIDIHDDNNMNKNEQNRSGDDNNNKEHEHDENIDTDINDIDITGNNDEHITGNNDTNDIHTGKNDINYTDINGINGKNDINDTDELKNENNDTEDNDTVEMKDIDTTSLHELHEFLIGLVGPLNQNKNQSASTVVQQKINDAFVMFNTHLSYHSYDDEKYINNYDITTTIMNKIICLFGENYLLQTCKLEDLINKALNINNNDSTILIGMNVIFHGIRR
eukprot:193094_1